MSERITARTQEHGDIVASDPKSLAETQIEHIERLIERQKSMTRLGLDDDFMTVSVGELRGAMAEAEQEWSLASRGIKYLDPLVQPPQEELTESHQQWVWLAGATPPHWEIRGTGAMVECERCTMPITTPYVDADGHRTALCVPCGEFLAENGP